MASVKPYKGGYRAQVYVGGIRDSAVRRTKREAEAWASARETELRKQESQLPGDRISLIEAMRRYEEEVSITKRGERWERLRLAAFGRDSVLGADRPIASITTPMLVAWRDARLRRVQAGTVLREISLLSDVFETARREWQWITLNPMTDMRKPGSPPHRAVVITRAQIRSMLLAMGYSPAGRIQSVSQAAAACFLTALRTGMRAGELCGLTWARVHAGYCVLPVTKTTPRDVPLTTKAERIIGKMKGWDQVEVFALKPSTLDALFRRYRERAGLEGFTFHDSRHTAATWLAREVDVLTLCKMFGWKDPKQAMTYYNPKASDIASLLNSRAQQLPRRSARSE